MEVNRIQSEIPQQQQTLAPIQKHEESREESSEDRSPAATVQISNARGLGNEIERLEMRESKLLNEIQNEIEPDSDDGRALAHLRNEVHADETIAQE